MITPRRSHPLVAPSILALVCFGLAGAAPLAAESAEAGSPFEDQAPGVVTLMFLRHAEAAGSDPRDPPLTEAGRTRARAWATTLAHSGATAVFSTEYRRTKDTGREIARALGLGVTVVSARDMSVQLEALGALPPSTVAIVVGHSNTVPAMVSALGGDPANLQEGRGGKMLGHHEHDRLFIVNLRREVFGGELYFQSLLELRH